MFKKLELTAQFTSLLKSFMGYLEGTQKSDHTMKSYRLDLISFYNFLDQSHNGKFPGFEHLTLDDIDRFKQHLLNQGLRVNTRRRKLLTVSKWMHFLSNRKKLPQELARKIPTPLKVERIPKTVSSKQLIEIIQNLPYFSTLEARNRVLLWTLAESGCLVSELPKIRFDHWKKLPGKKFNLYLYGGASPTSNSQEKDFSTRIVPISEQLFEAVQALKKSSKNKSVIFFGFNKFGPLSTPISSRGIELIVKSYAEKLGDSLLTPRTFRHSITLQWFAEGISQNEIQNRLGLKTTYAFRSYGARIQEDK